VFDMKNILFRVPIYRESRDEYYEFLTKKRDQALGREIIRNKKFGLDKSEKHEQSLRENPPSINPQKITWEFNRIIGWIDFYADGMLIKAALWFIRAKRVSKQLSTIIIEYRGKISDVTVRSKPDNKYIRAQVKQFLSEVQYGTHVKKLSKYYIDSDLLLRNLEYFDIQKLLEDLLQERMKNEKNA